MKKADKVKKILEWWEAGKIKSVGLARYSTGRWFGAYSVPSEAFVLGITPRLVAEVLEKKEE